MKTINQILTEKKYYKECATCGYVKLLSDFHQNPKHSDGVTTSCKDCMNSNKHLRTHVKGNPIRKIVDNGFFADLKLDEFEINSITRNARYHLRLRHDPARHNYVLRFTKKFYTKYPFTQEYKVGFIYDSGLIVIGELGKLKGSLPVRLTKCGYSDDRTPEVYGRSITSYFISRLGINVSEAHVVDYELQFLYEYNGANIFKMVRINV